MIKDIVSKLDVVLAQVLIEAVIAQVSLDDSQSLGVSYLQKTPSQVGNSFQGIGALNNKNLLTPGSFLTSTGTNVAGNLPGGFSYLATLGNNDLDVSVTALAGSSKAKILQRPRIQTSHAVPATLFVGEQRPYPVSSYYGGGAFGGYASIQQLQIGVTIEVTPLINPDGLVVMDIHTKIDSFEGNVTIQNVGDVPVTSSKDATAKVAVRDRDTIMLGGLIQDTKTSNNSGIPLLKDIPLLGYLFRSSSADNARQEMIVLIRPTVLPTPEVAALAARAEKDKMPAVRQSEAEIEREQVKRLHKVNQQMQDNK
jgi:general secretion pathway protein D